MYRTTGGNYTPALAGVSAVGWEQYHEAEVAGSIPGPGQVPGLWA